MAKRYLTKEEKRNFNYWKSNYDNGTLLTESDLAQICKDNNYDSAKIGAYILKLSNSNVNSSYSEFDLCTDDVPCI